MTACPHCGRPLGVTESVAVSPRDPRAEPVAAATAARVGAERADEATTAALAQIAVQRRRRESATVPAVDPDTLADRAVESRVRGLAVARPLRRS